MNQKVKLLLVTALSLVVIIGAYVLYNYLGNEFAASQLATTPQNTENVEDDTTSADNRAPDFTVYDAQGNPINLSDFLGKPVILNFWASWCGPCKSEMPDFQKAYEKYGNEIAFLIVNMTDGSQETVETASSFIEKAGYTFPVYFDSSSDAAIQYGVRTIPTTFFIDAQGNFVAWANGAMDLSMLEQGIDMIVQH